jgi:hypothetical protein
MANRPPTCRSLSIILWNANGILRRRNELEMFLHDERIDVALISESHLTSRSRLSIQGYRMYRSDHPNDASQGGTAIFIRSGLQHNVCPLSPPTERLQAAAVTIQLERLHINVAAVYCPPRFALTMNHFQQLVAELGDHYIVGGDFNAKHPAWGSRLTTPRGRVLYRFLSERNLRILSPLSPTYWPTAQRLQPDLIDFLFSRGINGIYTQVEPNEDLASDHTAVRVTLHTKPVLTVPKPSLNRGRMDWGMFQNEVERNLNLNVPLKTSGDIDYAVQHFTTTIQSAAWDSSAPRPRRPTTNLSVPQEIRHMLRDKRRARHTWQRTRFPEDRRHYNRLCNIIKKKLAVFKSESFNNFVETLNDDSTAMFRTTKRLLNHSQPCLPLRCENGSWVKSDAEKAELFASHLEETFTPNDVAPDVDFSQALEENLVAPLQLSLPPRPFTLAQIKQEIQHLPPKKSPGYDLITMDILGQLPQSGLRFLQLIFNGILRAGYYPDVWKFATVVLFLKPGKPAYSTTSYRPISLLPLCGKLFEKLLLPRLVAQCQENNIIPNHQFGFRTSHSTTQQLHRVVDFIAENLERGCYASGVFLDISAAFDKVWHKGLLFKLKDIVTDSYYRILRSFLENRYYNVRQGSTYSELHNIQAGVPQGAILSPFLYNVFTSDLPTIDSTITATYADDTVILANDRSTGRASEKIQQHLTLLEEWLDRWKIRVNANKSVHVTFTLRRGTCPPVMLHGAPVPQDDKVRYLGLWLDRRLTWGHHLRIKRLELNRRLKLLFCLLGSRSKLNMTSKVLLYKTLLRPVWTYGIQLFGAAAKSNLRSIQAFQSNVLRLAASAPWYVTNTTLHTDLKMPLVSELASSMYQRFRDRLLNHPNQLARDLNTPHHPTIRRLKRKWSRDLLN